MTSSLHRPRGRLTLAAFSFLISLVVVLGLTASAHAAGGAGYVYLSQTSYVAHEDQGELAITIDRTDDSQGEQIRYGVRHLDAVPGVDLDTVPNNYTYMQPGQSSFTFDVKILDRGINAGPVYADAYIFGSYPQAMGDATGKVYAHGPVSSQIKILHDDTLQPRDPLDLLGFDQLTSTQASLPGIGPLAEAPYWVQGRQSPAGTWARHYTHSKPAWSHALQFLADQPGVHRFYFWNTPADPEHTVARFLESTENQHPNTVIQLSTYSLVHGACGSDTSSPAFIKRYERWIKGLAAGIGNFHVVMFLELDSLITTQCMVREHDSYKVRDRLEEIREAVQTLETLPHTAVYIDAGAADAIGWRRTVSLLKRAGVKDAQGFFVNSTHFDWTRLPSGRKSLRRSAACTSSSTPARTARGRSRRMTASSPATRSSATRSVAASDRCRSRRATSTSTPSCGSPTRAAPPATPRAAAGAPRRPRCSGPITRSTSCGGRTSTSPAPRSTCCTTGPTCPTTRRSPRRTATPRSPVTTAPAESSAGATGSASGCTTRSSLRSRSASSNCPTAS
jgi:hypothetical protein